MGNTEVEKKKEINVEGQSGQTYSNVKVNDENLGTADHLKVVPSEVDTTSRQGE